MPIVSAAPRGENRRTVAIVASRHPKAAATVGSRACHTPTPRRSSTNPWIHMVRGGLLKKRVPGWSCGVQNSPRRYICTPTAA